MTDTLFRKMYSRCPVFNVRVCLCEGMEPQCRRAVGTLNYIKVDDCQSEQQIELHYCEVKEYTQTHMHTNTHTLLGLINASSPQGLAYKVE